LNVTSKTSYTSRLRNTEHCWFRVCTQSSQCNITTFTHFRSHKHCYANKYGTHCNKHFPKASC